MILVFLFLWIASALLLVREQRVVRLIVLLGIFSLISSICFFILAAPDIAMAEAVVSAFSTILFIVCFEKYYSNVKPPARMPVSPPGSGREKKENRFVPFFFTVLLAALFILFIPGNSPAVVLKDSYISLFKTQIGGENAVTAIYLGYRMYDTIFEALMLLVSIVAVVHLSRHEDTIVAAANRSVSNSGELSLAGVSDSNIIGVTARVISPILLLLSIYLIANGHISPGGGFHGGVVAAAFFVCRYMIYDISDIRIDKTVVMEKITYLVIVVFTVYFIFFGAHDFLPIPKSIYLTAMNLLLGTKVACGFFIVFYRFIAFERR